MMPSRLDLAPALAFALAISWATTTSAQADQAPLLDLSLDELLSVEVSSASWGTVSLREAPASVTVFERPDLERLGLRNVHDVLNWVAGAYSSRLATTGTENRTVLRGNPGTAGGGLLVIDGQRANTLNAIRPWSVIRNFPVALIERVEVIRGPGGARYGGGPSDEVVHVVTRRGETVAGARASAEGGYGVLAMATGENGDWRADLRASRVRDEMPEYTDLFDRFGRITSSTEIASSNTAIMDLGWRRHAFQLLHHESDITGYYGINGSNNPSDESRADATWWRYSGSAEPAGWTVDWFASQLRQRLVVGWVQVAGGIPPFTSGDLRQRGLLTHRASAGGITLRRSLGEHTLTLGGEVLLGRNTRADLQANYLPGPPFTFLGGLQSTGLRFSPLGARNRMTAVYLEDDWRLAPEQRLVVGLRHDRYEQSGSATSPRIGWIWIPDDRQTIKLLYQEAFFAPTLGQLLLQNNPVGTGNPDLEPTFVNTWELVYQRQWSQFLLRTTLYHRRAKDGFIVVPGVATTATTINAVSQRTQGLESSLDWSPTPGWQLRVTASSLLEDEYELPAMIAEAPPGLFVSKRTASALLIWQPGEWETTLGAHWRSREGFQTEANDPRAMLQVNWRPNPALRVWLHADNLFNARGVDIDLAGGLGVDPATGSIARDLPLPGREWQLGVEWSWR